MGPHPSPRSPPSPLLSRGPRAGRRARRDLLDIRRVVEQGDDCCGPEERNCEPIWGDDPSC
ncbi:MAG: hypothetical protein ACK55Z_28410, partial [bacterium]